MNDSSLSQSPVPAPIQALCALFEDELKEVHFPDVSRGVLEEATAHVNDAAAETARLEEAVLVARKVLQDSQDALLQKAQRALAYARIYAEENAELLTQLDGITLPRASRKASKMETGLPTPSQPQGDSAAEDGQARKKGRSARTKPAGMLFQEDPSGVGEQAAA